MGGYNGLASRYDTYYSRPRDRAENALLRALAYALGFDRGTVLDLGCGTGFLLDLLNGRIPAGGYLGVDASGLMIDLARSKHPHAGFLVGDLAVPPHGRRASHLWCTFALAHVPLAHVPSAVLCWELAMRAPGRYLITVPTRRHLEDRDPRTAEMEHCMPEEAWTPRRARAIFGRGCSIRGLAYTRSGNRHVVQLEHATVGRVLPGWADFLLLTGTLR